jgi:pimeloyl-ACP methyl ester carboxylesterase
MAVETVDDGFPVVMLHGLGGTSNMFQPQVDALVGYRLIRPDLPGSGRSPAPERLSFEAMADAVESALDALGVRHAHFLGHSMGTIICQMIAARSQERVASLVLLGALAEPTEATRSGLSARARLARSEGMAPIADQIVAGALSSSTRATQPAAVAFVRESIMRQDPECYARSCEALAKVKAVDPRRIAAPALLLTGDADAVNPPSVAQALADKMAGTSLSVIDRGGHWLTIEKPAECNHRIADFLKRVEQ